MRSARWVMSYILVASLGLWLAFAVSVKFMAPARSQEAPSSGDLPEEFLKEIENTQVPGGTTTDVPPMDQGNVPPPPPDNMMPPEDPMAMPPMEAIPEGYSDGGDNMGNAPAQTYRDGDYRYDPTGKRDPFQPFRAMRPTTKETPGSTAEVMIEPLQRWELDRLQIVGIMWEVKNPRAMVRDPDGVVFTVSKSSKIGRNEGYVAAIREGEVVVLETRYEDGRTIKEPRIMEFRK